MLVAVAARVYAPHLICSELTCELAAQHSPYNKNRPPSPRAAPASVQPPAVYTYFLRSAPSRPSAAPPVHGAAHPLAPVLLECCGASAH